MFSIKVSIELIEIEHNAKSVLGHKLNDRINLIRNTSARSSFKMSVLQTFVHNAQPYILLGSTMLLYSVFIVIGFQDVGLSPILDNERAALVRNVKHNWDLADMKTVDC